MPTFLHTADLHLDSGVSPRLTEEQRLIRRREMLQTCGEILDRAKQYDLLLISGDLFDSGQVSGETLRFLRRRFDAFSGARIFIAAGNHDPYTLDSVYANGSLGNQVHVFHRQMEYVDLPELKTRVHGISFGQQREELCLLSHLRLAEGWYNLVVIHGEVVSELETGRYNPISQKALETSGADYVALGHVHSWSGLQRAGRTFYAYPGIPEPRGFDETGEKGYLVGELSEYGVQLQFVPCCRRKYLRLDVDLTGTSDSLEQGERIADAVESSGGSDRDLYRLQLMGRVERAPVIKQIQSEWKERVFYAAVKDATDRNYDLDALAAQQSLRGEFVRQMRLREKALPPEQQMLAARAMILGLDAMDGEGT